MEDGSGEGGMFDFRSEQNGFQIIYRGKVSIREMIL